MHSAGPEAGARLSLIGGTGPEGRGLALRFARVGHPVVIGSRSVQRAEEAARELADRASGIEVRGLRNEEAAAWGELVFLTLPYAGLAETLPSLAGATDGKIVVSAIAPLEFRDGRPVGIQVESGSAAEEVQALLPSARVVSAFQTVDAHVLQQLDGPLDTDIIVCSDDVEARRAVVRLAGELAGARGLSGGRLATSRYVEGCTVLLVTLNRIYKSHSSLRIVGLDR